MDVHDKNTRSFNMSRIRGKNTKPEILVRKFLFHNGFRYRINVKELPGKPDIVLPKYNTVIFVNGCFWHAHENCELFKWPKSRSEAWRKKLEGNKKRDRENIKKLEDNGWNVIVIWECQLKSKDYINNLYGLIDNIKTISK
ncbi:MAG: very short patch repair endonuclease [bacterium]